jgi:SAM-dependent methyltransferase
MDAITSEPAPAETAAPSMSPLVSLDGPDLPLFRLGQALKSLGYCFTTVTPASHARVVARPLQRGPSLTDIFGWSRPFHAHDLPCDIEKLASAAGVMESGGGWYRSSVRFSSLGEQLYVHSAYPTDQADAVFFGPDTYRFGRVIRSAMDEMRRVRVRHFNILDVGAGSGAGGLYAASLAASLRPTLTLTDINPLALRYCRVNAALNDIANVGVVQSDLFAEVGGSYDLIISNPPYLVDKLRRSYRHGGGNLGSGLSLRLIDEGVPRLARGGRFILYTGSAIINGTDLLREALSSRLRGCAFRMTYEEIDPDVFGEELDHPPYDSADRIAVVSVVIERT